ncbi:4Fe-4S binding protein [Halovulum sp. GXIMD14793]
MSRRVMLCDCAASQKIDAKALENAGIFCSKVHSGLCGAQIEKLAKAMQKDAVVIACAQEAPVFKELAGELNTAPPLLIDIRDRAGWSEDGDAAGPKMAALLVEGQLAPPPTRLRDVISEGLCLIIGSAEVALPLAEKLKGALSVSCLISDAEAQIAGPSREIDVMSGRIRNAVGSIGAFSVNVDALRMTNPAGRGELTFGAARDGGVAQCDIILDLRGETPLFPAPQKRDGYLRADPKDPLAVADLALKAVQLVGTFEKPLHVRFEESLCAHSRAGQSACSRCLDLCPTGAITSAGDAVAIDPMICAGCGACAAVCPSGAVSYDDPPVAHLFNRLSTLATTYRAGGGKAPRLLVHDADHGSEMISLAARFGRGLPADVIPLAVGALEGFGHAEMLAALGVGFADIAILATPRTEVANISAQITLAKALAPEGTRIALLELTDPDALSDALYGAPAARAPSHEAILPLGGRREVTRLSARALQGQNAILPLPEGAPYGTVVVDTDACTLCLACAGLCPPGALADNPDKPELRFREDACLQCGLCANVCPEDAIRLEPRLDLSDAALRERTLKEEEPYSCIECGTLFGVKSTIERIVEKLEGQHAMFTQSDNARLIRMCDDCRIKAQYHTDAAPFRMGDRPRPRTTEDDLREREETGKA